MSFRTPPPDLPVCSRHDLRRQQRRILFRVPLRKQIRKFCRQRVFLRQNSAARADGTARSPRADSDLGTVGMALGASPPYLLVASVGHILRRERRIAFIVPLCQQVSLFMPGAEIVQRRTHCRSPPAEYLSACNVQADGSFVADCVSGTVAKNVQAADHYDIRKIYILP